MSIDFVIIGIQIISAKTKFVKNAITEFGPFMDKDFGWISIDVESFIPIGEKLVGNGNKITRKATSPTLLSEGGLVMDRVI